MPTFQMTEEERKEIQKNALFAIGGFLVVKIAMYVLIWKVAKEFAPKS